MLKKYVWGLDLSLSNSGMAIFTMQGIPKVCFNIPTSPKLIYSQRLKIIGDKILETIETYPPSIIVFEQGFYKFIRATQALYRVQGTVMYLLADCEQYFYSPATIKKVVVGSGRASKEEVKTKIEKLYPDLIVSNLDQSDAVATGLTYFIKKSK